MAASSGCNPDKAAGEEEEEEKEKKSLKITFMYPGGAHPR